MKKITESRIATAIGVTAGIAALILLNKKKDGSVAGIGGVLWDYAIMECEKKGINLDLDYFAQPSWVLSELSKMRKKFGYRQSASSKAMGRSENQSFYYALKRHIN